MTTPTDDPVAALAEALDKFLGTMLCDGDCKPPNVHTEWCQSRHLRLRSWIARRGGRGMTDLDDAPLVDAAENLYRRIVAVHEGRQEWHWLLNGLQMDLHIIQKQAAATARDALVERVAIGFHECHWHDEGMSWGSEPETEREFWRTKARAALAEGEA